MKHDLENTLAGIYLAVCGAIGDEATHRANKILLGIAADQRTPMTEANIYRDLVDCVEGVIPSPSCYETGCPTNLAWPEALCVNPKMRVH